MSEPSTILAGNTYVWSRTWSAYPATEWTLSYSYISQTQSYTVAGVANGSGFDMTLTSAASATWAVGDYQWLALVTKGAERRTAATGSVTVCPDPAAGPVDYRTQLEKLLGDLMSAYAALTTKGAMEVSVSVEGRSTTYRDRAEVWREIQRVQEAIRQEKVAAGLSVPGAVRVRFT